MEVAAATSRRQAKEMKRKRADCKKKEGRRKDWQYQRGQAAESAKNTTLRTSRTGIGANIVFEHEPKEEHIGEETRRSKRKSYSE